MCLKCQNMSNFPAVGDLVAGVSKGATPSEVHVLLPEYDYRIAYMNLEDAGRKRNAVVNINRMHGKTAPYRVVEVFPEHTYIRLSLRGIDRKTEHAFMNKYTAQSKIYKGTLGM